MGVGMELWMGIIVKLDLRAMVSGREMFDIGERESEFVEETGPMLTFWKKFWNPIDESSIPTCEGCGWIDCKGTDAMHYNYVLTFATVVWRVR